MLLHKYFELIIAWMSYGPLIKMTFSDAISITSHTPFCQTKDSSLVCDFSQSSEVIHLDEGLPSNVDEILVVGGKRILIPHRICVNLTLKNVEKIGTVPGIRNSCKNGLTLSIQNSTIMKLPDCVNHLIMKDSVIETSAINAYIKSVNLTNVLVSDLISFRDSYRYKLVSDLEFFEMESSDSAVASHSNAYLKIKGYVNVLSIDFVSQPIDILERRDSMGTIAKRIVKRNVVDESASGSNSTQDSKDNDIYINYSYFGAFIGCLVILLITFGVSVAYISYLRKLIQHIEKERSNPDIYDYREEDKLSQSQLIQPSEETNKEESEEETESLLNVNMEKYQCFLEDADELKRKLSSSLHFEKLKYFENMAKATEIYVQQVEALQQTSNEREAELENSKIFELENLEAQYEEELNAPTMLFWDKIKEILEKSKSFSIELIAERYENLFYNARVNDDTQRLQERASVVQIKKDYIARLTVLLKEHLSGWPRMLNVMRETLFDSVIAEETFKLLEYLLTSYQTILEENYERQITGQDGKYLNDIEKQRGKLSEICSNLLSSAAGEKEHLQVLMSDDLQAKLPWTKNYTDKVENMYSIQLELLEAKLDLEVKKAENEYSEIRVKLLHLDVILGIQNEYSRNLENIAQVCTEVLTLCKSILKLGLFEHNADKLTKFLALSKDDKKLINRPTEMLQDRFAQA